MYLTDTCYNEYIPYAYEMVLSIACYRVFHGSRLKTLKKNFLAAFQYKRFSCKKACHPHHAFIFICYIKMYNRHLVQDSTSRFRILNNSRSKGAELVPELTRIFLPHRT